MTDINTLLAELLSSSDDEAEVAWLAFQPPVYQRMVLLQPCTCSTVEQTTSEQATSNQVVE